MCIFPYEIKCGNIISTVLLLHPIVHAQVTSRLVGLHVRRKFIIFITENSADETTFAA